MEEAQVFKDPVSMEFVEQITEAGKRILKRKLDQLKPLFVTIEELADEMERMSVIETEVPIQQ
jgi:hypothetical protein